MAQTDRQTDTTARSPHWTCTMYGDECTATLRMLETGVFPDFVKAIYGGPEICPRTGRLHAQVHVECKRQVRMSQLKKIWPTAHLEPTKNPQASIKYALKEETSAGQKLTTQNASTVLYSHPGEIIRHVVKRIGQRYRFYDASTNAVDMDICNDTVYKWIEDERKPAEIWWEAVSDIIRFEPKYRINPTQFARPDVQTIWKGCWLSYIQVYMQEAAVEGLSITGPPNNEDEVESVREIIEGLIITDNAERSTAREQEQSGETSPDRERYAQVESPPDASDTSTLLQENGVLLQLD